MRQQLIPYRFDIQHPQYKRHKARNFGHWVDSSRKAALIVDRLSYYPIHYATNFPQIHPYTPEGRVKAEKLRKAGRLVTAAWRDTPSDRPDGPKLYGLLQRWMAAQGNRCTQCGKDLDKVDVQKLLYHLVGRLRNAYRLSVTLRCRTCLKLCKD